MSNFLDMRCPNCGDEDRIDIEATVWIRVTEEGTDVDAAGDGNHEYTPKSMAVCAACQHCATVTAFSPPLD